MSWSRPLPGLTPLSPALAASTLTVWRRTTGFAERLRDGEAGAPPHSVRHLSRWLATGREGLTLHLVMVVGGKRQSSAWLGLSALGAHTSECAARLAEPARDLAEAVDAWGLFTEVPSGGPRHAREGLGLRIETPGRPGWDGSSLGPQVLPALADLHRRPHRLALSFELAAGPGDAELLLELEREHHRMRSRLPAGDWWLFDPEQARLASARGRLEELWEQAAAGVVRVRLHGQAPGALLRLGLEEALSIDLGGRAWFAAGPPDAVPGWGRPLRSWLGTLSAGATGRESGKALPSSEDRVPF